MKNLLLKTGNMANALTAPRLCNYPSYTVITDKVCNMDYLNGITRGDKTRAGNLVDAFITEITQELADLNIAIEKVNYPDISNISHKMKSAFAILGIKILEPVIKEMEQLSIISSSIDTIKQLSQRINIVFIIALTELKGYT